MTVGYKQNQQRIKEIATRLSDANFNKKETLVKKIISDVRKHGDKALNKYTEKFDKCKFNGKENKNPQCLTELKNTNPRLYEALLNAKQRVYEFHLNDLANTIKAKVVPGSPIEPGMTWNYKGPLGETLGARYLPVDSVGIYIPGGQFPLLSTVLMTAIPAKVAGVRRIVMVSPPPIHPSILAVAELMGVDEIYGVGGAQAIAALAYGTESIKPVDKIVGPGNVYVSLAKKLVFGQVGIDGFYGPTELAVIADKSANPKLIAADMISQLEHGSGLESVLVVTTCKEVAEKTEKEFYKQLKELSDGYKSQRQIQIIENSFKQWSDILVVDSLEEAAELINIYAPEHLEIHQPDNSQIQQLLPLIKNAGAIFIGANSCESLGDYLAGPSHCLPTGGTSRFASGLQCSDFLKKTSIIDFSNINMSQTASSESEQYKQQVTDFRRLIEDVAILAREERLEGHARAMESRLPRIQ